MRKDIHDPVALVERGENELFAAGAAMAAKSLPDGLPPGIGQRLREAKEGMARVSQLKAESLEVVK